MQITDYTGYMGTASGYGPWLDVGQLRDWSLHIIGLEAGGTLTLWGSNEPFEPTAMVADASAAQIATVTGTGQPLMFQGSGSMHWLQMEKTAGGGATATTVYLFGQVLTY